VRRCVIYKPKKMRRPWPTLGHSATVKQIIIDRILRKTHIGKFVYRLTFHVLSPALRKYLEH